MDGIHDLGGMAGFGPVEVEPDEPTFHQPWERRARALTMIVMGAAKASGGEFRHSIERMDAGQYLTTSYYEHWLTGAATVAVEHGMVTREELEGAAEGAFPLSGPARAEPIDDPGPDRQHHRFALGDRVRVKDGHPLGHTRCPGYVRGHHGIVVRLDAPASVPDIEAHSAWRHREPTYSVGFDASELWRDGQAGTSVHVDLWESYLEAVAP